MEEMSVPEESGFTQVCALLTSDGELETDLLVTVTTVDGSAGKT